MDKNLDFYLKSGIKRCCAADGTLDPAVVEPWQTMLGRCHAQQFLSNPPDIGRWHRGFTSVLDAGEEGYRLIPIARHVAVDCGLTYPLFEEVDRQAYINSLKTPHAQQTYDEVFDKALRHVVEGWHLIAEAVFGNSTAYQTAFWDWNLDTGRDASNTIVLWQEGAL